ncbi:MAG: MCE family protein [Candidatus Accumulibacter sp.]|jgi:phospholipid/cholesterol/gamma-HCH transport system substrate-binding protein|uniref:MlaD family protein n=1 Tax=unclassified Candidatus Accumulibacter TaxID=2619054 RepID=UPI0012C1E408|nr:MULTISPECIES: MlaD family protein [unclassified Candidatus Accumulibacter]MBL8367931.1 MCE family protein [Accumulibacter sp.]MQM35176.1 mammalian cell entry protein [Candidatus Accumulibacter phosphatis]
MENRSHALIAGLFTLFLGVALVLSVWWIGGKHEMTRDYIVVTRQNVTGLSLQGQVRYRGIRVGKVQAIELDPADVRNILIRISVNDSVPVTRGTVAKMGYQGVTGIAHILLEESGDDPQPLPGDAGDASRIAMQPSLIEELSDAGGATLRAAGAFLSNANKLLDSENRQNFARILVNLEATTANANDAIAQFRQLLTQTPESLRLLNATLARAEHAAGQATPLLVEARELVVGLQAVSKRVDRLLGDPSPSGVAALAPRLNELGSELSANSRQLQRVLQLLEESPQSLVFGSPKHSPGPGEAGFTAPPSREGSR